MGDADVQPAEERAQEKLSALVLFLMSDRQFHLCLLVQSMYGKRRSFAKGFCGACGLLPGNVSPPAMP